MEKRVLVGIQKKKTNKQKKKFLKKVVDYLKSDSYMYAPLISSPPSDSLSPRLISSPPTGPLGYFKRVTAAISARKITKKEKQTSQPLENSLGGDHPASKACHYKTGFVGQQPHGHLEMEKRVTEVQLQRILVK